MRLRDRLPNYLIEADITDYETESDYIIYKDGVDTVAVDSHTGVVLAHNINSRVVFNVVRAIAGITGLIFVKKGAYDLDATGGAIFYQPANTWWHGEGRETHIILTGCRWEIKTVSNCALTDMYLTGEYGVKLHCVNADASNFLFRNLEITTSATSGDSGLYVYANTCTISNLFIDRCFFNTCNLHGVQFSGEGATKLIKNVWITDCYAYHCGWGGVWSTGMDLAEGNNLTDAFIIGCKFELSWESGLHFEAARTLTRVLVSDCISIANGQKAGGATFGAGYVCGGGLTYADCLTNGNKTGWDVGDLGTATTILDNCVDIGSITSFYIHDTGATGQLIGRGLFSQGATSQDLYTIASSNLDIEMTAHNTTTAGTYTTKIGSTAYPTTNSKFNLKLYTPAAAYTNCIHCQACTNIRLSGEIVTGSNEAIALPSPTDFVIENMRIDSTGTDAMLISGTVVSVVIKNTVIENVAGAPALTNGIKNTGSADGVICERASISIKDVTTPYIGCLFYEAWGTSTGTGAQQTIAHGLTTTPTVVMLSDKELNAIPYQSAAADAVNIYITAAVNQDWSWYARV